MAKEWLTDAEVEIEIEGDCLYDTKRSGLDGNID
jgi:hypothetical protein